MAQFQNHMSLKRKHIRIHSQIVHKWMNVQFKALGRGSWNGDRRVDGTDGASRQLVRADQALIVPLLLSGRSGRGGGGWLCSGNVAREKRSNPQKGVTKYAFPRNWSKYPDCALKAGSKRSCIFSRAGQSMGFVDGGWMQWVPGCVVGGIGFLNPGQTRLHH